MKFSHHVNPNMIVSQNIFVRYQYIQINFITFSHWIYTYIFFFLNCFHFQIIVNFKMLKFNFMVYYMCFRASADSYGPKEEMNTPIYRCEFSSENLDSMHRLEMVHLFPGACLCNIQQYFFRTILFVKDDQKRFSAVRISVGNSMSSSTIRRKHTRMSFSKDSFT